MAGVVFDSVCKQYDDVVAVDALDLTIAPGEMVTMLGPSGCGKSTVLRMLAGLVMPDSGRILIDGNDVGGMTPGERDIAMVFQTYALYPHMTVAQNIAYPLRKRGVARAERMRRVRALAESLQIAPLLDRRPAQLSGGQQQRVALGRAMVRDPSVFLFDEPLSNLDAKLRAHMRGELIELHRRLGRTMIYVTHDQLEAMTMATRIAVMADGALQQYGTPADIYERPANRFVAGFVGTPAMALIDGALLFQDNRAILGIGGLTVDLGIRRFRDRPVGTWQLTVGIRPEDVTIGDGPFAARISAVEPIGHETILTLEAGSARLCARVAGSSLAAVGETVRFALRQHRLHFFDVVSGRRIDEIGLAVVDGKAM